MGGVVAKVQFRRSGEPMKTKTTDSDDAEINAISTVYAALKGLQPDAQERVLTYVAGKLKIQAPALHTRNDRLETQGETTDPPVREDAAEKEVGDALEGVSPVARKWMARNGLQASKIGSVFSLGGDEIDLIATTVPGTNKKERMRSVFLLKGVASYLATGAARFTHEQMKDACVHYDAFDAANFASNLKSLSSEVTGSKAEGYALNPRGLAAATEMVKSLTKSSAG
jgi:hypothetical protein